MKQSGFSLMGSILLLVIMSVLAAFMVKVSGNLQMGTTLNVLSSRVDYGAQSGLEWARANVQQLTGSICSSTGAACCNLLTSNANRTFFLPPPFSTIEITIDQCTVQTIDEVTSYVAFTVQLTAKIGNLGETGFASKQVQGIFFNPELP